MQRRYGLGEPLCQVGGEAHDELPVVAFVFQPQPELPQLRPYLSFRSPLDQNLHAQILRACTAPQAPEQVESKPSRLYPETWGCL